MTLRFAKTILLGGIAILAISAASSDGLGCQPERLVHRRELKWSAIPPRHRRLHVGDLPASAELGHAQVASCATGVTAASGGLQNRRLRAETVCGDCGTGNCGSGDCSFR